MFYGAALPAAPAAATFTWSAADPNFIELTPPCPQLGVTNFGSYLRGGMDLNNDARPDLLIGNYSNKQVMALSSDFELLDCFVRSEARFGVLFDVVGDINGDGNPDLVTTHEDPAVLRASVFFNDGLGAFGEDRAPVSRLISLRLMEPAARKLAVSAAGDLNADGRDDIATVTWTPTGDLQVNVHY
ncbi:MAG: VCBS repeat-containing protein [Deltaproteobacteria bacterium]|nr:VCBS repeat-containing protein [Deltaproteobacteria bacterium]